jgi:PhnB protein
MALDAELVFEKPIGANANPAYIKPGTEDKILQAALRIGESVILVSDGHCAGTPAFQGFSLSVSIASEERAKKIVACLADRGTIPIPLQKTAWAGIFGTVVDKFGVHWTIKVSTASREVDR